MELGNVFLSREDIDSLSTVPNRLEPEFADVYGAWKAKDDETTRDRLLMAMTPTIAQTVRDIPGADPNSMTIRGKILAMNAMNRYDPGKSSLGTFLTHQLLPLRRTARQQMNVLGLPDRLLQNSQQLESAETELQDELGRMPTTGELSDRLGVSMKQIERIRRSAHARNTGSYLTADEEGEVGSAGEVTRRLPEIYRHQYVFSALRNDPKSALIYEHDQSLHGRLPLSTSELAEKLGLSPGAISQRRNRIAEIANNAEREIYGNVPLHRSRLRPQ